MRYIRLHYTQSVVTNEYYVLHIMHVQLYQILFKQNSVKTIRRRKSEVHELYIQNCTIIDWEREREREREFSIVTKKHLTYWLTIENRINSSSHTCDGTVKWLAIEKEVELNMVIAHTLKRRGEKEDWTEGETTADSKHRAVSLHCPQQSLLDSHFVFSIWNMSVCKPVSNTGHSPALAYAETMLNQPRHVGELDWSIPCEAHSQVDRIVCVMDVLNRPYQ